MRKEKGDGMRKQATYEHLTIQPLDGHHLVLKAIWFITSKKKI